MYKSILTTAATVIGLACGIAPTAHADTQSFMRNDFYGTCITDHGLGQPVSLQACNSDDPVTRAAQGFRLRHGQAQRWVIENDNGCLRQPDQRDGLLTLSTCSLDASGQITEENERFTVSCGPNTSGDACPGPDFTLVWGVFGVVFPYERRRPMGVVFCNLSDTDWQNRCGVDYNPDTVRHWTLSTPPSSG